MSTRPTLGGEPASPASRESADLVTAGPLAGHSPGEADIRTAWRRDELDYNAVHRALFGDTGRAHTIGRYTVLQQLGAGGMGVVYAAYDPQLDRKVALKLVRSGAASNLEYSARIRREAQVMARLSHPNVVQVYEVGEHEGLIFVAMEFIRGQTLTAWLRGETGGPPGPGTIRGRRSIIDVFVAAGRGLAAAHRAGVVHRDFKPDNVMIGGDGRVRVMDFGLARGLGESSPALHSRVTGHLSPEEQGETVEASLTRTGAILGTPAYMSPEQLRGEPASEPADQFCLCVALYEALYGRRPFAGETFADLAANVLKGQVRDSNAGARVPGWLHRVVVRGLAVDPQDRWPSIDALTRALENDPYRHWRRSAMALAGVALLVALAAVAWQAVERSKTEEAAKVVAQDSRDQALEELRDERDAAARKADEALIFKIETLIPDDPNAAVALLLELSEEAFAEDAWTLAHRARERGLATMISGPIDGTPFDIAVSRDERWIATSSSAGVWRWDIETGEHIQISDEPNAWNLALSDDGQLIAAHVGSEFVLYGEAGGGLSINAEELRFPPPELLLTPSADGLIAYSTSYTRDTQPREHNTSFLCWRLPEGRKATLFHGSLCGVHYNEMAISPDQSRIAAFDGATSVLHTWNLKSLDHRTFAVADDLIDGIRWAGDQVVTHRGGRSTAYAEDGTTLAFKGLLGNSRGNLTTLLSSEDKWPLAVMVVDASTGELLHRLATRDTRVEHFDTEREVQISAGGERVIVPMRVADKRHWRAFDGEGCLLGTLRGAESERFLGSRRLLVHMQEVRLALSPTDGQLERSGCRGLHDGGDERFFHRSATISPSGSFAAVQCGDHLYKVGLSSRTSTRLERPWPERSARGDLYVDDSGRVAEISPSRGRAALWTDNARDPKILSIDGPIVGVSLSSNGDAIAALSVSGAVHIATSGVSRTIDLRRTHEPPRDLPPGDPSWAMAFSPSGEELAVLAPAEGAFLFTLEGDLVWSHEYEGGCLDDQLFADRHGTDVAFTEGGELIAYSRSPCEVVIARRGGGETRVLAPQWPSREVWPTTSVRWASAQELFIAVADDELQRWSLEHGRVSTWREQRGSPLSAGFSLARSGLYLADDRGLVQLTSERREGVQLAALSPDLIRPEVIRLVDGSPEQIVGVDSSCNPFLWRAVAPPEDVDALRQWVMSVRS